MNFVFCERVLYVGTAPEQKTESAKNGKDSMSLPFFQSLRVQQVAPTSLCKGGKKVYLLYLARFSRFIDSLRKLSKINFLFYMVYILFIKRTIGLASRIICGLCIVCAECCPAMRTENFAFVNIMHIYRNTKH